MRLNLNAMEVQASAENFPLRKHNLIQAMLAVNDLFYLAEPMVRSLFYEDIIAWMELHEIRYTPRVSSPARADMTIFSTSSFPNHVNSPSASFKPSTAQAGTRHNPWLSPGLTRKKFVQPTHAPMRFLMIRTTPSPEVSSMRSETTM